MTAAEQGLSRGDRYRSRLGRFAAWNLPDTGTSSPGEAFVWGVTSSPTKMLQVDIMLVKVSSWCHGYQQHKTRLHFPCTPSQSCSLPLVPLIPSWRMRHWWGRKDAVPSPAVPLRQLGWLLQQLAWLDIVSQAFEALVLSSSAAVQAGHCVASLSHRTAPSP